MKKCLNISEEVVLPEIHEIEEHLVVDPPVQCEETVNIPAIVQEPNEVEQAIDPAWREYVYNVEDKFINAIITEYPNVPTILVFGNSRSNNNLIHYIGEQKVTSIITNINYYTEIIFLKDYRETGIDSQGRKFWVVRTTISENLDRMDIFTYSLSASGYYKGVKLTNNSLTFLSIGNKIFTEKRYSLKVVPLVSLITTGINILGIKIKGEYLYSFVNSSNNNYCFPNFKGFLLDESVTLEFFPEEHLGSSSIFSITESFFGLLKVPKMNIVEGSLFPVSFTCRSLKGDWNICDFSKYKFIRRSDYPKPYTGSIPQLGYYSFQVEEIIYPQEPFLGDSVYDNLNNCRRLRKLIYPPSMPYIYNAGYFLNNMYSLQELFIPEDFGSLSERGTHINQITWLTIPDFVFNIPNCRLLSFGIDNSAFNGIKFSKESQFVFNNSYNNVLTITDCVISREALVDIFNQLPDFTGQPTRTMSLVRSTGAQELTEEDIKIATDKNWVVNR
jgi:hypothetical protein